MEFDAIIFCGSGHNLSPLTTGESGVTKAILPVANKPMIEYVLEWCDQAPFKTINIVMDPKSEKSIREVISRYDTEVRDPELHSTSPIKCIVTEASSTGSILVESFSGTEQSENNYVILPCDFITDVPPQVFIELYRGNSDENIGLSVFYNNMFENIDNKTLKTNYTVYSNQDNGNTVLLDMYSKDFVTIDKFLRIRTQLLWRYPSTLVSTNLLDSFIFFTDSKINKIINDLLMNRSANKIKRDIARRSWKHSTSKDTVGLFVLPKQSTFVRCNNLPVYMEINRHFLKTIAHTNSNKPVITREKNAATIGNDSLVGTNTILGERTSVKRSVIGNNCVIGKKCRISACVILDGIIIEDDVQLENCIIGKNVKLEGKCKLINCNVEGSYIVGHNVNLKGETLKNISLDELSDDFDGTLYSEDSEINDEPGNDSYDDESFEEEEYDEDIFSR